MSFENPKFENILSERDKKIEAVQTEQERKLQSIRENIEKTTDGLGQPIDTGVKESVIMFNAFGLRTTQSCEGHSDEAHGEVRNPSRTPWIEIYPEEPEQEKWHENDELRGKVEKESREYRLKTINLLDEFYKDRKVSYDVMLGIDSMAYGFRVQNNGLEIIESLPDEQRVEKEKMYKAEMKEFTDFLKNKFLEK